MGCNLGERLSCGQNLFLVNSRSLLNTFSLGGVLLLLASCNMGQNKNHGPIVLGDSATIVTETDGQNLVDRVPDLRPLAEENNTPARAAMDTSGRTAKSAVAMPQPAAQPHGNGLTIAFKEVTIFIPDITTRSYGNKNLQNARGASYELQSGGLAGNQLQVSGSKVQKITQRYQTIIALKDGSQTLPLESLGTYASGWEPLRGNGSSFTITGLEEGRLQANNANVSAIRNAVQQAGRRMRMNRNDLADWQDVGHKVRSANAPPAAIILRSVSWHIEGTDAAGKRFNKEVRMDLRR